MHKTHNKRVSENMADHSVKDVVGNTSSPHRECLGKMRKSFHAHQVMIHKNLPEPTDRPASRVTNIQDSRNLHQDMATSLRSQNKDFGGGTVPTVISSFRSSLVSKLSGMESKCSEAEQLTSEARYSKNEVNNFIQPAASIPVHQQSTAQNCTFAAF
jgi:hypothetical protein